MLIAIVRAAINLAQPDWVRFRDVVAVILDFAGLSVVYILMFAGTWVVRAAGATDPSADHIARVVNQWIPYGLWISAVIALGQTIHDIIRLYKIWRWAPAQK
jgi:hypothetical protein